MWNRRVAGVFLRARKFHVPPAAALCDHLAGMKGPRATLVLSLDDRLALSLRLQEGPCLEFRERLLELLLRVHHDRAVPRHRFL